MPKTVRSRFALTQWPSQTGSTPSFHVSPTAVERCERELSELRAFFRLATDRLTVTRRESPASGRSGSDGEVCGVLWLRFDECAHG